MRLREDSIVRGDGKPGIYSVVEKPDFATIAALDNGGFWLVQQDRYPTSMRTWEFPQGTFDADEPEAVARAELQQECGLIAKEMTYLGRLFNAPGLTSQACHVFLATGLTPVERDLDEEEADLVTRWHSVSDLGSMILDSRTVETVTLATLLLLRLRQLI